MLLRTMSTVTSVVMVMMIDASIDKRHDSLPWNSHATAMQQPCSSHAAAMQQPRCNYAVSMQQLCSSHESAIM